MAVADYLMTLYERMEEISEIAEKKDLEAKEKNQEMVRRKYQREKIRSRRVSIGTHPRKEKQARGIVQRALHCDGASFACDVQVGFERTAWIRASGLY